MNPAEEVKVIAVKGLHADIKSINAGPAVFCEALPGDRAGVDFQGCFYIGADCEMAVYRFNDLFNALSLQDRDSKAGAYTLVREHYESDCNAALGQ